MIWGRETAAVFFFFCKFSITVAISPFSAVSAGNSAIWNEYNSRLEAEVSPYLTGNTLRGITVAVYCENHTEHTDTVRTTTEPNRLMLFGETATIYCESHTNAEVHVYVKGVTADAAALHFALSPSDFWCSPP
jgi:hypothetical protein